jgi:hypothetical protein
MTYSISHSELKAIRQLVTDTATRSLDTVAMIDETTNGSLWLAQCLKAATEWIEKEIQRINLCKPTTLIDPDDTFCVSLAYSQVLSNSYYRKLIRSRDRISLATNQDRDESLIKSISEAITQLSGFHNAVNELRWAVIQHDTCLQPALEKAYSSAEDLFKDNGVGNLETSVP